MPPTPQKIRKQRFRFVATAIVCVGIALGLASVFACSWLWQVLIGR